jgi:serine/threonine protein phosphatase PrpC
LAPAPVTEFVAPTVRLCGLHGISDTGTVRRHNEDRFLIDAGLGLVAVADGMGGHQSGAVASATALDVVRAVLARESGGLAPVASEPDPDRTAIDVRWRQARVLRQAIDRANADLYETNCARGHADGQGMGTTLTGWQWLAKECACVLFHVGDSRLYRYRDGALLQLTRDQTAYQQALESGGSGALPPQNVLLQAVGPTAMVVPDIVMHDVRAGDVLLLCSDGLHGWVPHADLQAALGEPMPLEALCRRLVALAAQHGSRDNITAVAARFDTLEAPGAGAGGA